jgi:hypothetical protein
MMFKEFLNIPINEFGGSNIEHANPHYRLLDELGAYLGDKNLEEFF